MDPFSKFLGEVNDAAKNDQTSVVPPEVMKQLGELGAYGLQVPEGGRTKCGGTTPGGVLGGRVECSSPSTP